MNHLSDIVITTVAVNVCAVISDEIKVINYDEL